MALSPSASTRHTFLAIDHYVMLHYITSHLWYTDRWIDR